MEELYRFVQLRPAQLGRVDDRVLVPTWSDPRTELHVQLVELVGAGGDRQQAARDFLGDADRTGGVQPLLELQRRVEYARSLTVAQFAEAVKRQFRRAEELAGARRVAGDILIAISLLPDLAALPRDTAHRAVVLGAAAQRFGFDARDGEDENDDAQLEDVLSLSMAVLPSELFPARTGDTLVAAREAPDAGAVERSVAALFGEAIPVPVPAAPAPVPVAPPEHDVDGHDDPRRLALRELIGLVHDPEIELEPVGAVEGEPDRVGPRLRPLEAASLPQLRLSLTEGARARLSESTRALLEQEAPGQLDLLETISLIERMPAREPAFADAAPAASPTGGLPAGYGAVRPPVQGLIRPPGVAELLSVRQEHSAYRLGAIAHIENVLAGESLVRTHRRLDRTEELTLTETERTETDERDLQTTDRFELVNETGSVVSSESELEVGATVSASYGPVSATANFGYTSSSARTDTARQATTKAHETVDRAVHRLTERTRELRQRTTTREVEETNQHTLANDNSNNTGIYRWVDEEFTVGVYSYGTRLMIEAHVPEPGAWLRWAATGAATSPPPTRPALPGGVPLTDASQVDPSNYRQLAAQHGAVVDPPPELFTRVGLALHQEYQGDTPQASTAAFLFYKSDSTLEVAEGYRAIRATGVIYASAWRFDVFLAVGSTHFRDTSAGEAMPVVVNAVLNDQNSQVPIAFTINNAWGYAMTLELLCQRTDRALEAWQLRTFTTLQQAYEQRRSAWEEEQRAAEISAGIAVPGRNPAINRQLEHAELKRAVIALLAGIPLDQFGAITTTQDLEPYVDETATLGQAPAIAFYEQAFEWEQSIHSLYPWFWGRHGTWRQGVDAAAQADAQHEAFLDAGVARVVVPVRPGFEPTALHFLATGRLWSGGAPPQIGDPLYVSIAQELVAAQMADAGGVLLGDEWTVRTPTTLVYLQQDADLNPAP